MRVKMKGRFRPEETALWYKLLTTVTALIAPPLQIYLL
jgi:hypothetical protein